VPKRNGSLKKAKKQEKNIKERRINWEKVPRD
jgi:hypothetical protein